MKEEFDIEPTGKQLPYQVPPGFFEEVTASTLAEAKRRAHQKPARTLFSWSLLSVAATVAVLLVAGYLLFMSRLEKAPELAQAPAKEAPAPAAPPIIAETTHLPAVTKSPQVAVVPAPAKTRAPEKARVPATQQALPPEKTQTLEEFLASMSDKELQQLAAIAEAEEYVYGEIIEE